MRRRRVERNIALLQRALDVETERPLVSRARYFFALDKVQEHASRIEEGTSDVVLDFDLGAFARRFIGHMMQSDVLPEDILFGSDERRTITQRIEEAFVLLARFHADAPEVVRMLVGRIVFARSPASAGGSVGDTLGQVWLSPQPSWDALRFADCLWHETTHQALFLADMLDPVFALDRTDPRRTLVTSAIRKTKRPYDLSFHAACVGTALVEMYQGLGHAHEASELAAPLGVTVSEFLAAREQLTGHGRSILDELVSSASAPHAPFLAAGAQLHAFEL